MPTISIPSPPPIDGAAATPSLRTLGTGSLQAMPGDAFATGTVGVAPAIGTVVTVYVRSTGNDSTGDGTIGLPYLTPERALQDCLRNPLGKSFRVDMSDYGTYTPSAIMHLPVIPFGQTTYRPSTGGAEHLAFGIYRNADIEFYATPTIVATYTSGQYTTAQYGGSANKAAHTTVTITASPGWAVNEHVGKLLVLSGSGASTRVISNTADTLTITAVYGFSTATTLKLCTESCTIDLVTSFFWLGSGLRGRGFGGSLTIAGFKFLNGSHSMIGFRCLGEMRVIGCYNVAIGNHYGDFLGIYGCDVRTNLLGTCSKIELWNSVFTDLAVMANGRGSLYVYGSYGTGGDSIGEGAYHGTGSDNAVLRQVSVFYTTHRDTARGGARVVGIGQTLTVGFCHFEACGYGGIRAQWGARCFINGPISGPAGSGTPSPAGVIIEDDSQLLIASTTDASEVLDATNITVTGTSGDLFVGDSAANTPWATFFANKVIADTARSGARVSQVGTKVPLELGTVNQKANASDALLTTTGATSVVTYTPASQGNYLLHMYYRVVVVTTDLTLTISWTDSSGAQTQTILSVAPQAVGSYAIAPTFINSTATAITLTATAGTANQIYVSANIMSV